MSSTDPFSDAFIQPADWAAAGQQPAPDNGPGAGDDALDDLSDLFGEDDVAAPSADLVPAQTSDGPTDELADVLSVEVVTTEPVAVEAPPAQAVPAAEEKARPSVTRMRQAIEDASALDSSANKALVKDDLWRAHRWYAGADLYPYVDRILGVIGSDQTLQARLNGLLLTRDADEDASNQRTFDRLVREALAANPMGLTNPSDVPYILEMAYDEWIGISVLGPLWRDPEVTEIMVDGWDKVVVERDGKLIITPASFRDLSHAVSIARTLSEKISDRAVNNSNPIVNAELPGARVNFMVGAVVKSGISISMRKFRPLLGMSGLMRYDSLSDDMHRFLADCVRARANVLVSGGTGTGKTTVINALSEFIPAGERVVTIEDTFELSLSNALVVSLQTKEPTRQDAAASAITQSDLLVNALRMRPDRIIIGEIREGNGAQVMLQAANTGHDGTMTTVHANEPVMAVDTRLPDMIGLVNPIPADVARRQIASAIDLVVQVTRHHSGRRFISAIAEIDRRDAVGGRLDPYIIFAGEMTADGPVYRQVNPVRSDTDLALKLRGTGVDPETWALDRPEESP